MNISIDLFEQNIRATGVASKAESLSLELLRLIDVTVDSLGQLSSSVESVTTITYQIETSLKGIQIKEGQYFDDAGKIVDELEASASAMKNCLAKLVKRKAAINKDKRLHDHHCDALHDAYESAMTAVAENIDALESLRAAVITFDLAAEPRNVKVFGSSEDLVKSLHQQ